MIQTLRSYLSRLNCLGVLLALGLLLRLAGVFYGLPSESGTLRTYHPDESVSFTALERWHPDNFNFHPGPAAVWGGFHLVPMAAALKAADWIGFADLRSRDALKENLSKADRLYIVTRLVHVLLGTLSIFLVFRVASNSFGALCGCIAAFFYAFSPVSILNSSLTRPEAMAIFLGLLSVSASLKIWNRANPWTTVVSGLLGGLATATEYDVALLGVFPVLTHLLSSAPGNRRNFPLLILAAVLGFLGGCPYVLFDPAFYWQQVLAHLQLMHSPLDAASAAPGFWIYFTTLLPAGLGWPLTLAGLAGWLRLAFHFALHRDFPKEGIESPRFFTLIWLVGSFILFAFLTYPKTQSVWHVYPAVPFLCIFAGYFFSTLLRNSGPLLKKIALWTLVTAGTYTVLYALACAWLLVSANVRETASNWMFLNISKGESIAVLQNSATVPQVLRQYHPPYDVFEAGSPASSLQDCYEGFLKIKSDAHYLVVTESDYRKLPDLQGLLAREFTEIKRFEKPAAFLGVSFPASARAPDDWTYPNPTIILFKKN